MNFAQFIAEEKILAMHWVGLGTTDGGVIGRFWNTADIPVGSLARRMLQMLYMDSRNQELRRSTADALEEGGWQEQADGLRSGSCVPAAVPFGVAAGRPGWQGQQHYTANENIYVYSGGVQLVTAGSKICYGDFVAPNSFGLTMSVGRMPYRTFVGGHAIEAGEAGNVVRVLIKPEWIG